MPIGLETRNGIMEELVIERLILRVIASLFILAGIIIRPHERKRLWGIIVPVYIITTTFHMLCSGIMGFVLCIAGGGAAFILTYGLYHAKRITETELLISIVIGTILGPVGYAVAFAIACILLAAQYILRAEAAPAMHFFPNAQSSQDCRILCRNEKPTLAEIEAGRILSEDNMDLMNPIRSHDRTYQEGSVYEGDPDWGLLPWRAKLALASLAVLLIGIP
ncbi:MAG: hypothetical protein JSV33_05345 [bacterium]|nr:MAG: hypothetical protein JSV33_05345 [bacterium]